MTVRLLNCLLILIFWAALSNCSTNEVELLIDQKTNDEFPKEFRVKLSGLIVIFEKIEQGYNYPLGDGNIYTINSDRKVVKVENNNQQEFEVYKEKYGNSFATLIRNEDYDGQIDNELFRMFGTIHEKDSDSVYDIIPEIVPPRLRNGQSGSKKYHHSVSQRKETFSKIDQNIDDYVGAKTKEKLSQRESRFKRSNNGVPFELYLELLVVTDTTIFEDHKRYAGTTDTNLIFLHMKAYFSHLINGVSQRYTNSLDTDPDLRLSIKLTNFLFQTNILDSAWTSSSVHGVSGVPTYEGREVIQASPVLNAFSTYINGLSLPFSFDHAVGFMNKDIWSDEAGSADTRKSVVGFAFLSGVCLNIKYSICEESGGFAGIGTIAHEIGHNLGSGHDGSGNNCPASDNFIMTPGIGYYQTNLLNLLRFSSCSINSFKALLLINSNSALSSQASQCLVNTPSSTNTTDFVDSIVNGTLPGQALTPDDQCKMIYGETASFCHNSYSSICTAMHCRKNSTLNSCWYTLGVGAIEGTTCDSGKMCIQGVCTASALVPTSTCPFGDDIIMDKVNFATTINLPEVQMSCEAASEYLKTNVNQFACLDSNFKSNCCNFCKRFDTVTCLDTLLSCSSYSQYCNTGIQIDGNDINTVCPRTCSTCNVSPVQCGNDNLCKNGGTCENELNVPSTEFIGFKCNCPTGYSGFLCETVNKCLLNPCKNGATCLNFGSQGYLCQCTNECSGYNCDACSGATPTATTIVATTSATTTSATTTSATTTSATTTSATTTSITTTSITTTSATTTSATTPSATTTSATTTTATTILVTVSTTASTTVSSTIAATVSTVITTLASTTSSKYQFDYCSPNPCLNNGKCVQTGPFIAICECPPNFTGYTCENTNPCYANPCLNGATCEPVFGSVNVFKCLCTMGFTGQTCQVDLNTVCTPQTCFNGGTCNINPQTGKNYCTCSIFYTGTRCETRFNPCISNGQNVCQNSGTCYLNYGASPFYQCRCRFGYTGTNCEVSITTTTVSSTAFLCVDRDTSSCPIYARFNYCSNLYYIYGVPVPTYCPVSCKRCSTGPGTTTAKPCIDSQRSCQFWGSTGNCHLLPDPAICSKSCGLC